MQNAQRRSLGEGGAARCCVVWRESPEVGSDSLEQGQRGAVTMEGENGIPAPPPSPASGSRWNPTKEQISLLEGLYKEGMRTPTAEQIQHITGRLKKYGRIEGKNVFYWFQNHKARQRQKQKQESFGYFARFLRNRAGPPVLYPAPPPPALFPATPACAAVNDINASHLPLRGLRSCGPFASLSFSSLQLHQKLAN
ncbi:hypothetical protein Taro_040981 [Colocasia esculenta]|uniref:Homeobox domain-containing protein n=1 Tax=Colocasia esculenta TaxID=4460 RepID=A0A843WKD0_COLES|nr:hypothetical protein [Colocasia esculenta]